jgi:hypothetical protein
VTLDALRQAWPGVIDAVKSKGRVAAIVVGNASVASYDEGVLTLRFPRQGDVKGFQGSKYEDLLKQAITAMFGINVVIRSVTGGGDAPSPGSGRRPAPAGPGSPGFGGAGPGNGAAAAPPADGPAAGWSGPPASPNGTSPGPAEPGPPASASPDFPQQGYGQPGQAQPG